MSLEETLRLGRKHFNKLMRDRCRIERPGRQQFNTATGQYESPDAVVIYEGKCLFKQYGTEGLRFGDGGNEREMVTHDQELLIPWDTKADIDVSDVVWMLETDDPVAVGKKFTVESTQYAASRNARHLFLNHQDPGEVDYA